MGEKLVKFFEKKLRLIPSKEIFSEICRKYNFAIEGIQNITQNFIYENKQESFSIFDS